MNNITELNINSLAHELQAAIKRRQKEQGKLNFDIGNTYEGWEFWNGVLKGKDMRGHINYPKVTIDVCKPSSPLVKMVSVLSFIIGFLVGGALFAQNSVVTTNVHLSSAISVDRDTVVTHYSPSKDNASWIAQVRNKSIYARLYAGIPYVIQEDTYLVGKLGNDGPILVFNNKNR